MLPLCRSLNPELQEDIPIKSELSHDIIKIPEDTYQEYNSSKLYKTYPIVNYLGYHQRKLGCYVARDRFFYIDTDGFAHIWPYSIGKVAKVTDYIAKELIGMLSKKHVIHLVKVILRS